MNAILILIPGFINLFLGFFVWNRARRSYLNTLFGIFSVITFLLIFFDFLFRFFPSLLILKTAYALAALIPATATLWVFELAQLKLRNIYKVFLLIPGFIFFVLSYGDGAVVKSIDELLVLGYKGTLGSFFPMYSVYVLIYLVMLAAVLFINMRRLQGIVRAQLQLVLWGLILYGASAALFSLILPSFFGIFSFTLLDAPSSTFFVVLTFYAISRYHLFDIKVIATEIFTGLLLLLLVLNVPNYTSIPQLVLNIGILIGSAVVSIFLIRAVLWEVKTREELERLAADLSGANEELKKLDKAKSEFVSIASHQLRTPLTAIKGYVSMFLEGTYGAIGAKQRKPIQNVFDSNERLIKLVNDLLNVSRIDAGRIELKLEEKDLTQILESVVEELKVKTLETRTKLVYEKPDRPLPPVHVDEERIRNVFLNILDNAIRYTPSGMVAVRMSYLPEQKRVRVEIKDTGEGMTKEELEHLFVSFSRGVAGTRFWTEGAGLGLYIAKKFVEMHKGRIWAESAGKSKGSTFIIELPLA